MTADRVAELRAKAKAARDEACRLEKAFPQDGRATARVDELLSDAWCLSAAADALEFDGGES